MVLVAGYWLLVISNGNDSLATSNKQLATSNIKNEYRPRTKYENSKNK